MASLVERHGRPLSTPSPVRPVSDRRGSPSSARGSGSPAASMARSLATDSWLSSPPSEPQCAKHPATTARSLCSWAREQVAQSPPCREAAGACQASQPGARPQAFFSPAAETPTGSRAKAFAQVPLHYTPMTPSSPSSTPDGGRFAGETRRMVLLSPPRQVGTAEVAAVAASGSVNLSSAQPSPDSEQKSSLSMIIVAPTQSEAVGAWELVAEDTECQEVDSSDAGRTTEPKASLEFLSTDCSLDAASREAAAPRETEMKLPADQVRQPAPRRARLAGAARRPNTALTFPLARPRAASTGRLGGFNGPGTASPGHTPTIPGFPTRSSFAAVLSARGPARQQQISSPRPGAASAQPPWSTPLQQPERQRRAGYLEVPGLAATPRAWQNLVGPRVPEPSRPAAASCMSPTLCAAQRRGPDARPWESLRRPGLAPVEPRGVERSSSAPVGRRPQAGLGAARAACSPVLVGARPLLAVVPASAGSAPSQLQSPRVGFCRAKTRATEVPFAQG